ncbi:hypothetical protein PanWU01x14_338630, partial [Parasponia andersonii]
MTSIADLVAGMMEKSDSSVRGDGHFGDGIGKPEAELKTCLSPW